MSKLLDEKYGLFIDGKWRDAENGDTFTTYNPANGEPLAKCAAASASDVDLAVKSACKAFSSWKKTSPSQRAELLLNIASIIDENAERLAMIETLDNGKPIRESRNIEVLPKNWTGMLERFDFNFLHGHRI